MEVPGSSQLKWLPKAARGGAGPGEPGSSIASYGRRGIESTRAGVAEGTVGVGASSPLSREALGNARGGDGPGHVQRGRCRGVRGGEGTCAGRVLERGERAGNVELGWKSPAAAILNAVEVGRSGPIRVRLHDLHAPAPPS